MAITELAKLQTLPTWSSRRTRLVCVNVIEETPDVKTFQFKSVDPQLFHFKPGQFIGVQLNLDGVRLNRSYTIASAPTRPHLLELTIKLDPAGAVSPWLHQNIHPGVKLEVRGPAGRFNCFDLESDQVLLLGAGSGITPLMSMVRYWTDLALDKDIRFLNWVRGVEDIIFRREVALLDQRHPLFQPEVICTHPGLKENWLGRRGRVNATLLQDMVPDLAQRSVFCCGPEGFMEQVKQGLTQLGFDLDRYHEESFDPTRKKNRGQSKPVPVAATSPAAPSAAAHPQMPRAKVPLHPLTFARSGKTVDIGEDEILLERIEAEGIAIDSACRLGNCGSCQVKKISGETVTENETGLTDEARARGKILTCTTCVTSPLMLDL